MGREVRRVPLDFNWPLQKVWEGFVNPHYVTCPASCDGGYSVAYRALHAKWYGHVRFRPEERGSTPFRPDHPSIAARAQRNSRAGYATEFEAQRLADHFNGAWMHHLNQRDVDVLVEAGRLMDLTHTWTHGTGWQPRDPPVRPTAAEVNAWSLDGLGHDSINAYCVIKAECERLGLPHTCEVCSGSGIHPDHHAAYEAWTETVPPEGEGWQMWENTTEGSPISPVVTSPEDLARWLADTGASAFGYEGASYNDWLGMIVGPGWAMTAAIDSNGVAHSGVSVSVAAIPEAEVVTEPVALITGEQA